MAHEGARFSDIAVSARPDIKASHQVWDPLVRLFHWAVAGLFVEDLFAGPIHGDAKAQQTQETHDRVACSADHCRLKMGFGLTFALFGYSCAQENGDSER